MHNPFAFDGLPCKNCRITALETALTEAQATLNLLRKDIDHALAHQVQRSKGGQQVGHDSSLSYAPRSVLIELQRILKG